MKRTVVICILGLAIALSAILLVMRTDSASGRRDSLPDEDKRGLSVKSGRQNHDDHVDVLSVRKPTKPVLDFGEDDEDDQRTPAERELAERIEKALEDENFELAASCADEAQKCGVVEIRQAMVDTLGWFGEKALPELAPFLADADEDVRESAMNEWTMALSSIEDDEVKIKTVELAMGVLKDEDALEDISSEYIGVDEKLAVESLVRIIDGGGPVEGVEKAKETYEFVTGDEWVDAAEAARWVAEEYEPPEES